MTTRTLLAVLLFTVGLAVALAAQQQEETDDIREQQMSRRPRFLDQYAKGKVRPLIKYCIIETIGKENSNNNNSNNNSNSNNNFNKRHFYK